MTNFVHGLIFATIVILLPALLLTDESPEPLLIYATLPEIRGLYLRSEKDVLIHKAISKANAVTVDPLESKVLWSEVSNKSSVYSSDMDGHNFEAILTNGLMEVEGIAVDYVARNLYLTDSGLMQILVCKLDGSMCHVLHQTNVIKPRGIALDPAEGFLYWSDWGPGNEGIYRSGMDGSSRIAMVSEDIKWPNGISIDHVNNRLYWVDASLHTIEYVTLDGDTRKVVVKTSGAIYEHPFGLTKFENNFYWSDWGTLSVCNYNNYTKRKTKVIENENKKFIMGVYVHHPVLTINASNPCLSNSCSHMCLIAPVGNYSCACPFGFKLSDDGRTCTIDEDFPMLWVNDNNSIYRIKPGAVGNNVTEELSIDHVGTIQKLAYDWNTKTLFVIENHPPAIYAINTTDMSKRELVEDHLVILEDLAFDSTNGNLYWIDSGKGSVEVISTTTFSTAVIIKDLQNPKSIALVPAISRMFISTIGESPSVSMYDMNGQNGKMIVSCAAHAVAVHPSTSLLYWADFDKETINLIDYSKSTSSQVTIRTKTGNVLSLAVNEKNVYWTDSQQNGLTILKHNVSHIHIIRLPDPKSELASRKVIYTSPISQSSRGKDVKTCSSKEFRCADGTCIDKTLVCDQRKDCEDDSDEKNCSKTNVTCATEGHHLCQDGLNCIYTHEVCDGYKDCESGDDEVNCTRSAIQCTPDEYFCVNNSRCISRRWICDGDNDCGDAADEIPENCIRMPEPTLPPHRASDIGCHVENGGCSHLCLSSPDDGHSCACPTLMVLLKDNVTCADDPCNTANCSHNCRLSSEGPECFCNEGFELQNDNKTCLGDLCNTANCSQNCRLSSEGPECFCDEGFELQNDNKTCLDRLFLNMCQGNEFRCNNGRCILLSWRCDRRNDCGDNSDEVGCYVPTSCAKDQFSCGDGECIPKLWRCDGEKDCSDNSDEADCHSTSCDPETQLRCDNGQCIPESWVCDGTPDCFDSTDEMNCTAVNTCEGRFACGDGECIPTSGWCDGKRDCRNGRDEIKCPFIACVDQSQFRCGNGQCIPKLLVCNGVSDCIDNDDERNCEKKSR